MGRYLATSLSELEELIRKWPEEPPSVFLADDGLAALYYDQYPLRDLKRFFEGDPDPDLCEIFGLNAGEWREAVGMALFARTVMKKRQNSIS